MNARDELLEHINKVKPDVAVKKVRIGFMSHSEQNGGIAIHGTLEDVLDTLNFEYTNGKGYTYDSLTGVVYFVDDSLSIRKSDENHQWWEHIG